jgi:hypothetical protein
MRKVSTKALLVCLMGEFIVLLSLLFLSEKSNYLWIAVGIVAVLLIGTFYMCACNVCKAILNWNEQSNLRASERISELKGIQLARQTEIFEKLNSINNSFVLSNKAVTESMEIFDNKISSASATMEKNVADMADIMQQIREENKLVCTNLSEQFTNHSDEMSKQHSAALANIVSEMRNGVELLTTKYSQALDEMSQRQIIQIEEWKAGTVEILNTCNGEISTLVNSVEGKLIENSDIANSSIKENISTTKNAIAEMVREAQELLNGQYVKIDKLYANLSQSTQDCSKQVMEQMRSVSADNISQMKQSCEDTLGRISDRLVSENEQTGQKRTEAFRANMQELENTYDKLIGEHIKALECQVIKSIELFVAENKEALNTNNQLANDLISSEQSFVSEIEKNNGELKLTISNAFEEYSKSVEQSISDMKEALDVSIRTGTQSTTDSIDTIVDKNSEAVAQLAEKLRDYSDSLVEKSAIAIADVQAENNTKLQEVCVQVAGYVSENANFIAHCKEQNTSLNDQIVQLVGDRKRFVDDMKMIVDNQLAGIDDQMKKRINDLIEKIQNLNIENVEAYNETMVDYRDKFVEANAKAIAEVQSDNVNSITDANEKVSQLAENLKKFQGDIAGTLELIQSIINAGIEGQQTQDEEFEASMNEMVDEKLTEYDRKLQEYNDMFASLEDKITEVMAACHSNTAKYEETLRFIMDAQKEANSLNSKDIELLNNLMR